MRATTSPRRTVRHAACALLTLALVAGAAPVVGPFGGARAGADSAPDAAPAPDGTEAAPDAPPAPFHLDDTTKQLSDRIGDSARERVELDARLAALVARRATLAADVGAADARLAKTTAAFGVAVADLDNARTRMRRFALEAYKHHGVSKAVDLLVNATDARSFGFGAEMLQRADAGQERRAEEARNRRDRLARDLADARAGRDAAAGALADLDARIAATDDSIGRDDDDARTASEALAAHLPDVFRPGTPILGAPELTAEQLLAWYRSTGAVPHLDVDIAELIADYLAEGAAEHVRGDIAFLQSIVETGYFSFPGTGQVGVADHNFAGIGACDSCDHGDRFTDAREGVRAQIQLLRFYADASMTERRLANPAVRPLDRLGVKGCCPTWYSLTGTWATAPTYGPVVLDLLRRVLDFAAPPA